MLAAAARADEGLWLYNQVPKALIEEKYKFRLTDEFLDHLRLASVKLGASGSFVSPKGLIFTNHHVASGCIQKVSDATHNYMRNGFYAATEADELKCPDQEANVLLKIADVTAKVRAGLPADTASPEANRKRQANIAAIEKDCVAATRHRCDVVTLYSGGQYHLYEYKKYTDLRLVFAPEEEMAFFGGDPDNFTYPRYDYDITFLRAYENGKPADTPQYLRWSREGVKEGELIFVSGHPAFSGRLETGAQLAFERDVAYPFRLERLRAQIELYKAYGATSAEAKRVARNVLFSAQNSFKSLNGQLIGLRDPALMNKKLEDERKLRASIDADPKLRGQYGKFWDQVAPAYKEYATFYKRYTLLEGRRHSSELFRFARTALRLPVEKAKPNDQRLREYRDSALPAIQRSLSSRAPITDSLEIAILADYLGALEKDLGANDATVKAALAGRTPQRAAEHYVSTSKLKDAAERRRLAGSVDAATTSEDGMMQLVRILDGPARQVRKQYEDQVEAVVEGSAAKIALARFAVYGANGYPDATGTLRFSFGPVRAYRDRAGKPIPYATSFQGLYQHATGADPYHLPDRWVAAKGSLNLATPLNFVSTADILGGNSGSPTVNTRGEVVGILFDSNIDALPNDFLYDDIRGRAVHVASQGIIEGLRKVYKADRVLKELGM